MKCFDVAIVGGGPAGLTAALTLARARRRVAVLDSASPRNAASPGVQGFLSRDRILPAELKDVARKQIWSYGTVQFPHVLAERIGAGEGRQTFEIHCDAAPVVTARYVVLATGVIDVLPDICGFRTHWARNAIHCEFCHGWENFGRRWGILVNQAEQLETIPGLRNWADDIVVFAGREFGIAQRTVSTFRANGIEIERRAVRRLIASADGELAAVELEDGTKIRCGTLIYRPAQRQTGIVAHSGARIGDDGRVIVDVHNQTSVPGIFAAGDLTPGPQDALTAAANGAAVGRRLSYLLATDQYCQHGTTSNSISMLASR